MIHVNIPFPLALCVIQFFHICLPRKYLIDHHHDDPNYDPLPEDRPGGFNWGEGQQLGENQNQPPNVQ
jgi:hypothetical protein